LFSSKISQYNFNKLLVNNRKERKESANRIAQLVLVNTVINMYSIVRFSCKRDICKFFSTKRGVQSSVEQENNLR